MIEQCGYKEFEIDCGESSECDGYNIRCPMYTTHGHILEFEEMFGIEREKDLEINSDWRLNRYYNHDLYGYYT